MTSATAADRPVRRRRAPIVITIVIVAALVVAFFVFAGVYADILWYDQLGFLQVLTTQWFAGGTMFLIGFLGMAVPVWVAIQVAYRSRPVYAKLNSQLDRYQQVIEPLRRLAMWGIPALLGLFAGVSSASRWQLTALWLNRTASGTTDPQFHFDTSFYLFELPFYHAVLGFASAVVLLALILGVATSYLYGAIRVNGREVLISKSARIQIAVTAGVYLLLQAVSIWLDQYSTVTDANANITGPAYTDVHATIPGRAILAGAALFVAILFFITAFVGRWRFPLVGTALLIIAALIAGSLYPWVVQRFQVDPSEKSLETPYIQRNIDLTRQAFGVDKVKETNYDATTDAEPGALRSDADTTASIRIIDPAVVTDTYKQLEQFRQYYQFPAKMDVDRYTVDGKSQDAVVAVRDLDLEGLNDAQSWVNTSVVYTHGYGLVAAYGNQRSADGQPVFMESGIPSTGVLGDFQPRVYFGENSPTYSIVGAPKGTTPVELDYPSGDQGSDQKYTTFSGNGGPKLDNVFKKLVYALKFQSQEIFLSDSVNDDSQILYDRDPTLRVQKVAPYLTLDSDPYPSVVDGRIVWIVDGYTTSDNYPYSTKVSMGRAVEDTETPAASFANDDVNYIRNSVKATVDAYDGKVTLYAWDDKDPLLKTWEKVYPSTVKPLSSMSGALMSHVRYPSDMFKVQRMILGRYHVTDPGSFYSRNDAWVTPDDPNSAQNDTKLQPPYFLTLQMPGQQNPAFSLYSTFIPESNAAKSRNVLTGYLAADADAGSTAGKKSADYGSLRLLTLPKTDTVPGPGQVQANFDADATVSQQLNLLRQGSSTVINGNLLTLPVGGGLLYVQPVYVKSKGSTSYPLLQKVLVSFGDQIAFEDTLDASLDVLFGGDSGAAAGDQGSETTPPSTGTDQPSTGTPTTGVPTTGDPEKDAQLKQLASQAQQQLKDKDAALKSGDFAAYGVADAALAKTVSQMISLLGQ
ncbi:UPF0182 family membrane protein [Glaciibacter flavus]|uniref:UPF0182 family membrane protein n=1 Tax=Orlajensenia flava TaxID=2565934 RepID=UPI003AFF6873